MLIRIVSITFRVIFAPVVSMGVRFLDVILLAGSVLASYLLLLSNKLHCSRALHISTRLIVTGLDMLAVVAVVTVRSLVLS